MIIQTQARNGDKVANITQVAKSTTYDTIQSWVGLTNDSWSGITSFDGQAGDIVYIYEVVSDKNNRVGYMKCRVNSYDSGNSLIYCHNMEFILHVS